jgi:hypothetical protein
MYGWIWKVLPGGWRGKTAGSFLLLLGALALLFFVIFPWVEPRLPFNHVTVTPGSGSSVPSSPAPSPTTVTSPTPISTASALPGD